jgi:hypothetical protein
VAGLLSNVTNLSQKVLLEQRVRIVNISFRSRSWTFLCLWVSVITLCHIPPHISIYFPRQQCLEIKTMLSFLASYLHCRNDFHHRSLKHLWFLIFRSKLECGLDFELTKDGILHFHPKWQERRRNTDAVVRWLGSVWAWMEWECLKRNKRNGIKIGQILQI